MHSKMPYYVGKLAMQKCIAVFIHRKQYTLYKDKTSKLLPKISVLNYSQH